MENDNILENIELPTAQPTRTHSRLTSFAISVDIPDAMTDQDVREYDQSVPMAELRAGLGAVVFNWQKRYGPVVRVTLREDGDA